MSRRITGVRRGARTSGLPDTLQEEIKSLQDQGSKAMLRMAGLLLGVCSIDSVMDPKWIPPCPKSGCERTLADPQEILAFWGS